MRENPKPFEQYMHFKGKKYQIIAVARHSENDEKYVVYQQLYAPFEVYVRPLDMFMSKVDTQKYPNVEQTYRFEKIDNAESIKIEDTCVGDNKDQQEDVNTETKSEEKAGLENTFENNDSTLKTQESEGNIDEIPGIDPDVMEFLDAKSYDQKLLILSGLHRKITDDMINIMAVSLDTEIKESDDIEKRYTELKNSLIMMERFECNRLR
ncbi:MAG: DUF1653 domain-containing protein [Lachnospiraceae bacterium]|nr:DUF1653 domain-containing protein [Lachnospiraceae bacterium]